jgi:Family of unknown function (DUF6009)
MGDGFIPPPSSPQNITTYNLIKESVPASRWQDRIGKMVWLDNPLNYTYLRETIYHSEVSHLPNGLFLSDMDRVVGYQLISHETGGVFIFRFWWLKTYDRDIQPEGIYKYGAPCEAVIPLSVVMLESKPYREVA